MSHIIDHLQVPYYAVIFSSIHSEDLEGYREMDARMQDWVARQPGFLGFESARQAIGLTVSYWESLEAIAAWRRDPQHQQAQQQAPRWYRHYRVRICRVEREYGV